MGRRRRRPTYDWYYHVPEVPDCEILGSERLAPGITVYSVSYEGLRTKVLAWTDGKGMPYGFISQNPDIDVEYVADEIRYSSEGDDADRLRHAAAEIPGDIRRDPMFDPEFEQEDWHGDSNGDVYERVVGSFADDVIGSGLDDGDVIDLLDLACECCYQDDAVTGDRASEVLKDRVASSGMRITGEAVLGPALDRKRRSSVIWLLTADPGFRGKEASVLYSALIQRPDPTTHQSEILDACLGLIDDRAVLATDLLDRADDHYHRERIVRRMERMGHMDIMRLMLDMMQGPPYCEGREVQVARLRRDMGLEDTAGLFVRAFLGNPSGKLLLDAVTAHPELDREELIASAWDRPEMSCLDLIFFAENGMASDVSDRVLEGPGLSDGDSEEKLYLAEVLASEGLEDASLEIIKDLVEEAKRDRDTDTVLKCMWIVDGFSSQDVDGFCDGVSAYWRRYPELAEMYGNPENGRFRLS